MRESQQVLDLILRLKSHNVSVIVVSHNIFGAGHGATGAGFVNIYAAVPSLHVGWAVWAALVIIRAEPQWRFRYALWLYPAITTFVVIGTANHYVIDAVAGLVTIMAGGALARLTLPGLWRTVDRVSITTASAPAAAELVAAAVPVNVTRTGVAVSAVPG